MAFHISPFLSSNGSAQLDQLAVIHLKRDHQMASILRAQDNDNEGYKEGKVINTRFGSFPHSTLLGLPWGSQVRASKVDTGSRGRRDGGAGKKRKRNVLEAGEAQGRDSDNLEGGNEEEGQTEAKEAITASSGFVHLLPPTPENWTSSLPHRTQVVYTPDYSYILHRIRARPGTSIIEAGAGSGSFTHASTRAVYSGYPSEGSAKRRKLGKVWSFEFHEQRHEKLVKEIDEHGLNGIVELTHRDVCNDGFLVGENKDQSPNAEAVFLDLPAPWLALPHLTRGRRENTRKPRSNVLSDPTIDPEAKETSPPEESKPFVSALNTHSPVHICTFSPCIEQVQRTVSALRHLGWVDISMVEIQQKRLEIRRERIGLGNGIERGVQPTPASVDEAVARLEEVEGKHRSFHGVDLDDESDGANSQSREQTENHAGSTTEVMKGGAAAKSLKGKTNPRKKEKGVEKPNPNCKANLIEGLVDRKIYKEGRLVHRSEPDLKTHTSYLVFAVLPQVWTDEDEMLASEKWKIKKVESTVTGGPGKFAPVAASRRQMKKAARQARKDDQQPLSSTAEAGAGAGAEGGPTVEDDIMADGIAASEEVTQDLKAETGFEDDMAAKKVEEL